jgi:hypothetical protein
MPEEKKLNVVRGSEPSFAEATEGREKKDETKDELEKMKEKDIVKELLRQNLDNTEEILHIVKKLHRHLLWQRVTGMIYIIIILAPIILAILFLPSYLRNFLSASTGGLLSPGSSQKGLLEQLGGSGINLKNLNLKDILPQ